jgi:CheY-like chemotaxis protein
MSLSQSKILGIDDDEGFLEGTKTMLEKKGLEMEGVTNGADALYLLKEQYFDYDLVIIDLAIPEMDGIEIYKAIKKINPEIPLLFASAHFDEQPWVKKLKELNVNIKRIDKPFPMVTSPDFIPIEETVKSLKESYRKAMIRPYQFSLAEFMKLTEDERNRIFETVSLLSQPFVEHYFKNHRDKDWIIIAHEPGKIVDSGVSADEPFEDDLWQLSREIDAPVFTYSREKIIEQIDYSWSYKSNSRDYYPTVCVVFSKDGVQKPLIGDFDTGSVYSFLSFEKIAAMDILDRKPVYKTSSRVLRGERYSYYNKKLPCMLSGNTKTVDIELRCELVKDWEKSPHVMLFGDRDALVGRNLLLDNKVKLVLDGDKKETDVI